MFSSIWEPRAKVPAPLILDKRSIDFCLDVLLKLKQWDGQCSFTAEYYGEGLWTKDTIRRCVHFLLKPFVVLMQYAALSLNGLRNYEENPALVSEANATLECLKNVSRMLADLSKSLNTSISTLRTSVLPFQLEKGLNSLPDDILAIVFQHVGSCKMVNTVCRRFYHVASNLPRLWSTISNYRTTKDKIMKHVTRSGSTGLEIDLSVNKIHFLLDPVETLDALLPYIDRWETVIMTIENHPTLANEVCRKLWKECKNVSLTQLRSLAIKYPIDNDSDEDNDSGSVLSEGPTDPMRFFESLDLPALRRFHVTNLIPNPFVAPALRSLWIELHSREDYSGCSSPAAIVRLLSALPELEELRLSLGEELKSESYPPVTLAKLTSLRMDVIVWLSIGIQELSESLIIPSIRRMHINIEQVDEERARLSPWFEMLLPHDDYPTLEEFTFQFSDVSDSDQLYDIPVEKFANLRKLSLDTPGWRPDCTPGASHLKYFLPALRVLSIREADGRWEAWLEHSGSMLEKKFEELRVETGMKFDKEFVEEIFTGKRVVWEERGIPREFGVFE